MTYWVEVHCDIKSEAADPEQPWKIGCYTLSGEHPGAGGNLPGRAARHAGQEARSGGWQHKFIESPRYGDSRMGWICPFCKTRAATPPPEAETPRP